MSATAAQLEPVSSGAASPQHAVAELLGIKKSYYKPNGEIMVQALRGVDLRINRGEYVAIMGSSGSGKSTLMNVLGCLDRPSEGDYLLDGKSISKMNDEELSHFRGQKIGFIFQAFNLIPQLTIEENIEVPLFYQAMPKRERRERALAALALVELTNRVGHRPRELSGGQQQRVAIARALVTNPRILLADEPTGALDSKTGAEVMALFDDLNRQGLTLILVTHDSHVAQHANRQITLSDGVIVEDTKAGAI